MHISTFIINVKCIANVVHPKLSKNKRHRCYMIKLGYIMAVSVHQPEDIKMVGGVAKPKLLLLEDILSEKQVHHTVKQALGDDVTWELKGYELKPATDGLAGFLGDHMRGTLRVCVNGELKSIHLFIKCLPMCNKPKADFINENNYFRREKLMFKVLEEIRDDNDPKPWCPKAYLYTDSMIVMPDLARDGYVTRPFLDTLDLQHMLLGAATIARFHAAYTNYETKKSIEAKRLYNANEEHGSLLDEPTFGNTPFLKACAKLTANFIKEFSTKPYRNLQDLESKLTKMYLIACDSISERKGTLNVLIHKDLWVNNIMFKYEDNVPTNALIVDFQLIRYVPPAFDLMTFIYLTTSRSFREQYEKQICEHYFSAFCAHLDEESKQRMKDLNYDKDSFLYWCEQSRMFSILEPACIHPFILMDPKSAQKTFDDPETYDKYINEDRTEPVVAHAKNCSMYKERFLEICEEFVERYIL